MASRFFLRTQDSALSTQHSGLRTLPLEDAMADSDEKKDEIPAFKFSQKKVDDSWKEEVRREREAAARAAAAQRPQAASAAPAPAAPANEPRPQGSGPAAP